MQGLLFLLELKKLKMRKRIKHLIYTSKNGARATNYFAPCPTWLKDYYSSRVELLHCGKFKFLAISKQIMLLNFVPNLRGSKDVQQKKSESPLKQPKSLTSTYLLLKVSDEKYNHISTKLVQFTTSTKSLETLHSKLTLWEPDPNPKRPQQAQLFL